MWNASLGSSPDSLIHTVLGRTTLFVERFLCSFFLFFLSEVRLSSSEEEELPSGRVTGEVEQDRGAELKLGLCSQDEPPPIEIQ